MNSPYNYRSQLERLTALHRMLRHILTFCLLALVPVSPTYDGSVSHPRSPSTPTFPSPSIPTYSSPHADSGIHSTSTNGDLPAYIPTYPVGANYGDDCYESHVNLTDVTTGITTTESIIVCPEVIAPTHTTSSSASGGASWGLLVLVILLVGIVVALVCLIICGRGSHRHRRQSSPLSELAVVAEPAYWHKVRQQMQQTAAGASEWTGTRKPPNGTYLAVYEKDGRDCEATVDLTFSENAKDGGLLLRGRGRDEDGTFVLLEGLWEPNGAIYWIAQCAYGNVLTEGRMSKDGTSFKGTWNASNGISGAYQSFQRNDEPEVFVTAVAIDDEPNITV